MSGISTHVLDLVRGKPASKVSVKLARYEFGGWMEIASRQTGDDGRADEIVPSNDVAPGKYRLLFDIAGYHNAAFYPEVAIVFLVAEGVVNYHLPLLLSPHGYTTYRGS